MTTTMNGATIRLKRITAGLSGIVVCRKLALTKGQRICRSRLSEIERCQFIADPEELARIAAAIDDLTAAQDKIRSVAMASGWPGAVPVHA